MDTLRCEVSHSIFWRGEMDTLRCEVSHPILWRVGVERGFAAVSLCNCSWCARSPRPPLPRRQIRGAAVALRRPDCNEDRLALLYGIAQIRGEEDRIAAMPGQQLRQVFLEDGHATLAELFHLGFVVVHADHAVANFGKAGCRHKSHVTGPDYTDCNWRAHALVLSPRGFSLAHRYSISRLLGWASPNFDHHIYFERQGVFASDRLLPTRPAFLLPRSLASLFPSLPAGLQ